MFLRKTLLYSENILFLFYRSEMPLKSKMIVYIDRNGNFLVKVLYLVREQLVTLGQPCRWLWKAY